MFDPVWQKQNGFNEWIISLDLDLVITGRLDEIFKPSADFMILQGVNAVNPNPFNASVMMLKAGCHPEVWWDFSMEKAGQMQYHEFPDDQGWIWHKLPNASGWPVGKKSGIYGFQKPGWPSGWELPVHARIVSFIGKRKPQNFTYVNWIKKCWLKA